MAFPQVLLADIYPGTKIGFIPLWLAVVWRIAIWAQCLWFGAVYAWRAYKDGSSGNKRLAYGRIAIFILLMQQAVLNAERMGDPLTYESLIPVSIALVFVFLSIREGTEDDAELKL